MNVTVEVNNNQAIGGFIILGIVVGIGIAFCYVRFRGDGRGGSRDGGTASAVVNTTEDVVVI